MLSLTDRWGGLLAAEPKLRIRDAAARLGVSEAELLAAGCGNHVTRLAAGAWSEIVDQLPSLGRCMALTRNEHAVHERFGHYREIAHFHGMGQVAGPDIDLRLIYGHWRMGFAVTEPGRDGEINRSLQFFDADGTAVHKVYHRDLETAGAYEAIVERFRADDQRPEQAVSPVAWDRDPADAEIDVEGLRQAWAALRDTHDFFGMLKKFKAGRQQALRLAGREWAEPLRLSAACDVLEGASRVKLPIMVFVASPGVIQIHTGEVRNIRKFEDWLNVLDPEFNLHLRESGVASAWLVRKPTVDGRVTSIELFDAAGANLLLFFGKRKPGQPEDDRWRALAEGLRREGR
jgi:putative hemin transport protein